MIPDIRLAIVVNPELPLGLIANTVGAIAIGIGARVPALGAVRLVDVDGNAIDISSNLPVPILQATPEVIAALTLKAMARADEATAVVFPAFARALHDYRDYEAKFPTIRLADETVDGLGIAGPAKWVKSLTGSLKLLR